MLLKDKIYLKLIQTSNRVSEKVNYICGFQIWKGQSK